MNRSAPANPLRLLLALAFLALLCCSFALPASAANADARAAETARLVNGERARAGLPPLELDLTLCELAQRRAVEESASKALAHQRPDGRPWYTILDERGISCRPRTENLAYGQKTPREAVRDWMASPSHRAAILGGYTKIGVGVCERGGVIYWSQLFVNHDGSAIPNAGGNALSRFRFGMVDAWHKVTRPFG